MKIVIVGAGLIGCSFALAARRNPATEILALEVDAARARRALELGIIERLADQVPDDAEAVLLAVPSDRVASWACQLAEHPGLTFDAASVKLPVLQAVRRRLGRLPPRFVPSHPVAGSERSGPDAARADLFDGHAAVLTPEPETDGAALAAARALWQSVGARVGVMSAAQHDRALAATSHLPHLLSFAYVGQMEAELLPWAGGGFRDFTRIAAANPEMWARIFRMNKGPLLAALAEFRASLEALEDAVRREDERQALAIMEAACAKRRALDHD